MDETVYHVPVLLGESVDGLLVHPDGVYADLTFGGGGHSREILSRMQGQSRLYGFDQDADAMANLPQDSRFVFVRSNFRYLSNWMRYYQVEALDGILADLGVSSHHLDDESRGFSFRFEGPLDMRMNRLSARTAADVLNEYDEERLADVFYLYGELRNARKLAQRVVRARSVQPLRTIEELLQVVQPLFERDREKKELAKLFQALRIEVNSEMDALREMLAAAARLLKPGGRLVVITYHSLEDRLVKNLMKTGNVEGNRVVDFYGRSKSVLRQVNNKVIVPTEEELARNPRSRSAKLRIAERI